MKQTNNAIKFLMAQYRAIFKNANIAMVAAMAAAALAAGSANAATANDVNLEDKAEWDAALTAGNGIIDITGADTDKGVAGKFKNLKIAATADTTEISLTAGQKLVISDNKTDAGKNILSASGNGTKLNLTGAGDLDVKAVQTETGKTYGLTIAALDKGTVSAKFNTVNVNSLLNVSTSGASSSVSLDAANIVIGDGVLSEAGKDGQIHGRAALNLGLLTTEHDGSGSVVLGSDATTITINKDGKLRVAGNSGASTVNAAKVNVNGGIVSFAAAVTDGTAKYAAKNTTVKDGWFSVKSGAALTIDMTAAGKMSFEGQSTFDIGGETTLANGTIDVGADTVLAGREGATGTNAQLKLGGTAGNDATLSINKQTLKSFLTAQQTDGQTALQYVDENAQFATPSTPKKDATSGALTIGSGGFLEIKDAVDLATDLSFSGSVTAGKITVEDGGKIGGADITISETIADAGTNVSVKATNLTLGKASAALSDKLGVKALEAENVTFLNKDTDFNLLEKLTLSTTGTGTISGGLVIGNTGSAATVTINGGNYTFETGKNLETHAEGKLVIDKASKLDASGVKNLKLASGAGNTATVQLSGGSTLVLDQTDVFKKGTGDAIDLVKDSSGSNITKEAISSDATSVLEFKLSDAFKGSGDKFTMSKTQVENVKKALADNGLDGVISFGNNFVLSGLSGDVAIKDVIDGADVYNGHGVTTTDGNVDKTWLLVTSR